MDERRTAPLRAMATPPGAPMGPLSIVAAAARRRDSAHGGNLTVLVPGMWAGSPHNWWAVTDGESIVALFKRREDANRFAWQ